MSSEQSFNCIFCKETFDDRESLQVHFRKHGDPNLHEIIKTSKKRPYGAVNQTRGPEGSRNDSGSKFQSVSCDVCTEVFPSAAKAICHKHKVHTDNQLKHFCPWCGKLFPIKHLFDKHLEVHDNEVKSAECLTCDQCQFEFFKPAAINYHTKFFHRQDSLESPSGPSRKYRQVDEELLQLYYCPLCGLEFFNKVNINKHMSDAHPEEKLSSEEVLRCPLCAAAFYHLDAYTTHLTFHSNQDIYCGEEDHVLGELTEFTLERVPPVFEKMEPATEEMDVDKFLEVGLDLPNSNDSNDISNASSNSSVKPSHKKSKKEHSSSRKAITLDEFLNMNKDVFGDCLDFQGVEEIPSQVVANQLRMKKPRAQPAVRPGTKVISMDNLQKLKQQGVIVHMKTANKKIPITPGARVNTMNNIPIGKPIKIANSALRPPQPGPQIRPNQQVRAVNQQRPFIQVRPVNQMRPPIRPRPIVNQMRPIMQARPINQAKPVINRVPNTSNAVLQRNSPQVVGKPLKILPNVIKQPTKVVNNKKVPEEAVPGPFSCFKKPKESLIPISDVPSITELLKPEPSVSVPTQSSKPMVTPALKTVKPSATLAGQSRPDGSPVKSANAQSKTIKMSPPVSNHAKPTLTITHDEENSDKNLAISKASNLPLEALEKLKRQGLLIKKPKLETDQSSQDLAQTSESQCLAVKSGG